MDSKIVFGMAVKNEANTLEDSVNSVRAIVDEIFISVDVTSDEATLKKAYELTKNVFRHSFTSPEKPFGSFCDLRNLMIKHAEECGGTWFTWLDGHEVYKYAHDFSFQKLIADHPSADVFMLPLENDGVLTPQARLWKLNQGIHWIYDFHNKIWGYKDDAIFFLAAGCLAIHSRAKQDIEHIKQRDKQRFECCLNYFTNIVKNNPNDARSWYYIGNTYGQEKMEKEAYEAYMKGWCVEKWPPLKYQLGYYAACALYNLERYGECEKLCRELNDIQKRSETFMLLGQLEEHKGNTDEAVEWYQRAARCQMPYHEAYIVIEKAAYEWEPLASLASIFSRSGDKSRAAIYAKEALKFGDITDTTRKQLVEIRDTGRKQGMPRVWAYNSLEGYKINFLTPLVESWNSLDILVKMCHSSSDESELAGVDAIFCDWCDNNAISLSQVARHNRLVVRLHGYEGRDGLAAKVNWNNVDDLIFVSNHLMQQVNNQIAFPPSLRQHVVHNGVDLDRYKICEDKKTSGKNLAFVGNLNSKKNLPLLLYILKELPNDYILHVAGDWQETHLAQWWFNYLEENGLARRVVHYGHRYDINRWLSEEIDYLISPSVVESFGLTIAEAMACGVTPVIHNRPGVKDLWPSHWIFDTAKNAADIITQSKINKERKEWKEGLRQWVTDRYDMKVCAKRIEQILKGD